MNRRQDPGSGHRVAMVTLLMGALWTWPAAAQTARDTAQSAAEQRRAKERDSRLRDQAIPEREARPDAPKATPALNLPLNESPCFVIEQIELRGDSAGHFGWVLDALTTPDVLDAPLRRCLGAAGTGVLVQRAQHAVVARGFATTRVMVEPQDLTQGILALTVMPGRIRQLRFAKPAQRRPSIRVALPTQPGELLNLRDIELALENFKRVPGVEVDIQIVPANEPGLSDLVIDWTPGRPVRLQLDLDDGGSRSTGRYQSSATLSLDNPLSLNDLFYVGLQGSLGGGDPGALGTTGSSASAVGPAVATGSHRWRSLVLAAGCALLWPAQAQISADPAAPGSQRPTVLNAANGVPLVNITTPSAAGVSRNTYRQFDVGSRGVILNNSRTNVQTQLGGWVGGNPWLAAGGARVILNEVNSSQPSQLNGLVEVGGQSAEVIIANPAGISVNGGGFINASRATLTTGAPVMNAGALEGFRVQGGQVRVEGLGLDASTADHAAILARAVAVNAGIWSKDLTVVTGVNDVSADASRVTAKAASGAAPAFALDVAALGGMYAGKIRLVGTEAGLGVNQAGLIDAQGALTLDVNGWLGQSGGARLYGDVVSINARGVRNQDGAVIAARDSLSIVAGEIHNTEGALLLSAGDMALSASERIENRSASIEALGSLSITTPVLVNANDHITHTVVSDATTHHTVYYTPGGALDSADVAWGTTKPYILFTNDYDLHQRTWLLPKTSAYADPAFKTYYLGALPFVEGHTEIVSDGEYSSHVWVGDAFAYGRSSPIWAHFGMSAPTWDAPGQMPRTVTDTETGWTQSPDPQAVTAWQTQAAPWEELSERVARFKTAVEREFLRFDAYSNYAQTTQRAVMTHSEPARLVSGGAMRLQASQSLLNQDSEIVAGGTLSVTDASVTNHATQVSAPTSRSGTFSSWGVTGRDCDPFGCDPEYGWIHTPYSETIANTVPLPALRFDGSSTAAPSAALTNAIAALSILNPDPTSGPVFETDPRFVNERQWLSSDHLLRALAVDPVTVQKQLGDGFIEQRLVREQVGQLTGLRFLGDFTDDEAQFLALMNAGATFAQAHQLRPGIALSALQVAALTSDIVWLETQTITLPDGSTTQALVPRVYLVPRAGDLAAGGALIAGRNVQLNLSGDVLNTGSIAGRELVQISTQNVVNTGLITGQSALVSARDDVNNIGGTLSATDALVVQAGRDLNAQTTTAQGSGADGVGRYGSEQVNRVTGLYVSNEAGVLLASAGRDVNLMAAALQAGGVQVQAGRDLNLSSINTSSNLDATRDARNFARVQQSGEVGTQIQGASVALQAGQDITARAASVQATQTLAVQAGRDVNLSAGEASYQIDHGLFAKSSGVLSSSSTETRTHNSRTDAVGTALGGAQVLIRSGQDINLTGSSAVADERITVTAARDVNVTAAQTRSGHSRFEETKESGVFSEGGMGVTIGKRMQSTEQQTLSTGAAASTVGAIGGDVTIAAGQTYRQTGSDVLAPSGNTTVQAQSIAITEARTTERTTTEQKFKQSGLSVGLSNPVIDALQGVANTAEALANTGDARTQALGLAVAALQGKQLYDAAQAFASNPAAAAGVGINISLGSSESQSNSEVVRDGAQGSNVVASGNVTVVATAPSVLPEPVDGHPEPGSILVQGSTIEAGNTARFTAEGDIHLSAATQTTRENNSHSSKSGSIGVGFSAGGAQSGVSLSAGVSRGNPVRNNAGSPKDTSNHVSP
ncbi:MAG: hemagglutinin repeat-containing protein [Hydrogenophaga sp.]|uniref:two-partner secretion domain-containing protein n=1 Tax=Hydrogenophaga sp. TaxID=1904254 RepID=UPI002ABD0476|nr:hemagglutinin repeat-containing protein [Hydrogenophaga sp.]MDZ4103504.1 hemagglutinin repeat-containing protein [Hydrogenophaga sp.]